MMHEELSVGQVIQARLDGKAPPGVRLGLSIEGGAVAGATSGGMVTQLGHHPEVVQCFDAVYGTSIGAVSGAFLLSQNHEAIGDAFVMAAEHPECINPLRLRNVLNLDIVFSDILEKASGLDYEKVILNDTPLHPLVMTMQWQEARSAVDAYSPNKTKIEDPELLKDILYGACKLPAICSWPSKNFKADIWDAAFHEPFPGLTPSNHGITHLLILHTQPRIRKHSKLSNAVLQVGRHAGAKAYAQYCQEVDLMTEMKVEHIFAQPNPMSPLEKNGSKVRGNVDKGSESMRLWMENNIA